MTTKIDTSDKTKTTLSHSILHAFWLILNLLTVSCLLLADCGMLIAPITIHLPALAGLAFPVLFVINAFFAVSWLFTHRKWWCVVSLLGLAASIGGMHRTWSNGEGAVCEDGETQIKVLTYNTHLCQLLLKSSKNDVLRYVKRSGADIVFLQEYEVRRNDRYLTFNEAKQYLASEYPYTYFDFAIHNSQRQYGIAIYSKYPLINKQTIAYESNANISGRCDAIIPNQQGGVDTIRLINNHLESNSLTREDVDVDDTDITQEEVLESVGRVVSKMKKAYAKRAAEAKAVRQAIDESPYRVIVCGDFNDVPVSYTYRTISRHLNDAFLQTSRFRTGHTLKKRGLGIRIDYILSSPSIQAIDYQIDEKNYSDHFPSMATLVIKNTDSH